jgi:hypothetical protein
LSTPEHERSLVVKGERYKLDTLSFEVQFTKRDNAEEQRANIQFSIAPHICAINCVPAIERVDPKEIAKHGKIICTCCGKDHGTISEWVHKALGDFFKASAEARNCLLVAVKQSPNGSGSVTATFPMKEAQRVNFQGKDYVVRDVTAQIHAVAGSAPLELKQFEMTLPDGEVKVLSQLEGTVAGKNLKILMPEGAQSKRICLRIDNSQPPNDTSA